MRRRGAAAVGVLTVLVAAVAALWVAPAGARAQAPETTTTTAPDPAAVAARAAAAWSPPSPVIRTNPPPERAQVAGLATWLWVEPPGPIVVTANEGPTAVALEARARSVRFDFGDGTTLTCTATGVPYDPTRPEEAQSSDCTHVWAATSGGGTLDVSATRHLGPVPPGSGGGNGPGVGVRRRGRGRGPGPRPSPRPPVRNRGGGGGRRPGRRRASAGRARRAGPRPGRGQALVARRPGARRRRAGGGWDAVGTVGGWTRSFERDVVEGTWDAVKGLAQTAVLLNQTLPISPIANLNAIFNFDGYKAAWGELAGGVAHTVTHPWELAGIDDIANGKPGRAVPDILLLLLPLKGAKGLKKAPAPKARPGTVPRAAGGANGTSSATAPPAVGALPKASSRTLAKNMKAAGVVRPQGSAAHHVVAGGAQRAASAQGRLRKYGIDINSAENGVFLPKNTKVANPSSLKERSKSRGAGSKSRLDQGCCPA